MDYMYSKIIELESYPQGFSNFGRQRNFTQSSGRE
jgi:hypothetical protein